MTDYEIGLKADWLNGQLRTNVAAFHSIGKDVQSLRSTISATTLASLTFLENRGRRIIDGFEAELVARPANWFTANASVSYLDARLEDPVLTDVTWVSLTPEWAWNMGVAVTHDFASDVTARLRIDLSHRAKMFDSTDGVRDASGKLVAVGINPDATLLSARLTLAHDRSGVELSLYGRNLLNDLHPARQNTVGGLGIPFTALAEPRVIGADLKIPFGKR